MIPVLKPLPTCEHMAEVPCHLTDLSSVKCQATCDQDHSCCTRKCVGRCWECQDRSDRRFAPPGSDGWDTTDPDVPPTVTNRIRHVEHSCDRQLQPCLHVCKKACGTDHKHSSCQDKCLRVCPHGSCGKVCGHACAPCEFRYLPDSR